MQPSDTIGSHLCERLLAEGNDIICIDNYFTGHKSNIRHLLSHPNFEVIRHDIVYPYMAEIEEIYNLACPASPIYYQHDPIKTTQTSVIGSINMLGMAKYNRAKILQASTSEVYGDPLIHPQREDYWGHVNPLGIRSCYDEGKRCAESLFMSYYREHGIPVKIIRIFNTYGPKMDINDGRVVSNFIVQALRGDNITIYGDGGQIRDWLHVEDHVRALLLVLAHGRVGETYAVGGHCERRNIDVVHAICDILEEMAPQKPEGVSRYADLIRFVRDRPGHDGRYAIDASKIAAELGWRPRETFATGLRKTVRWYLDNEPWWRAILDGTYRCERLGTQV